MYSMNKVRAIKEGLQAIFLVMIGILFYMSNERSECVPAAGVPTDLSNATQFAIANADGSGGCHCHTRYVDKFGALCTRPWDFTEAFYFSMVSISTVRRHRAPPRGTCASPAALVPQDAGCTAAAPLRESY